VEENVLISLHEQHKRRMKEVEFKYV